MENVTLSSSKALLEEVEQHYRDCLAVNRTAKQCEADLNVISVSLDEMQTKADQLKLACLLSEKVSEIMLEGRLSQITDIVNDTVNLLFSQKDNVRRKISFRFNRFRDTYTHINVELSIQSDDMPEPYLQAWSVSGDGLCQIVSTLITICVLQHNKSEILILDESFNGLSSEVKPIFISFLEGLSDVFQIFIIEHGVKARGTHYGVYQNNSKAKLYCLNNAEQREEYKRLTHEALSYSYSQAESEYSSATTTSAKKKAAEKMTDVLDEMSDLELV